MRRAEYLVADSEEWESLNPVLDDGQLAVDNTINNAKVGDGAARWNDLDFISGGSFSGVIDGGPA